VGYSHSWHALIWDTPAWIEHSGHMAEDDPRCSVGGCTQDTQNSCAPLGNNDWQQSRIILKNCHSCVKNTGRCCKYCNWTVATCRIVVLEKCCSPALSSLLQLDKKMHFSGLVSIWSKKFTNTSEKTNNSVVMLRNSVLSRWCLWTFSFRLRLTL